MSPTGALGMNSGIRMLDLGWKLDAVLRGCGCDLLRSYGIERRLVALRNVNRSSVNLRRML
jgi:2-polyprenyl-6-methoxyphenol hydroxylase-like FAD-dependent oxidoreductase